MITRFCHSPQSQELTPGCLPPPSPVLSRQPSQEPAAFERALPCLTSALCRSLYLWPVWVPGPAQQGLLLPRISTWEQLVSSGCDLSPAAHTGSPATVTHLAGVTHYVCTPNPLLLLLAYGEVLAFSVLTFFTAKSVEKFSKVAFLIN